MKGLLRCFHDQGGLLWVNDLAGFGWTQANGRQKVEKKAVGVRSIVLRGSSYPCFHRLTGNHCHRAAESQGWLACSQPPCSISITVVLTPSYWVAPLFNCCFTHGPQATSFFIMPSPNTLENSDYWQIYPWDFSKTLSDILPPTLTLLKNCNHILKLYVSTINTSVIQHYPLIWLSPHSHVSLARVQKWEGSFYPEKLTMATLFLETLQTINSVSRMSALVPLQKAKCQIHHNTVGATVLRVLLDGSANNHPSLANSDHWRGSSGQYPVVTP